MIKILDRVKRIVSKELFLRLFRYTFIGVLTTIVSFGVYWFLCYIANINPNISNSISVVCAVIFAYITNKMYVFKSKCSTIRELCLEMVSFFSSRAITMCIEIGGVFLLYTCFKVDAMLSKIIISVLVVILNYVLSHFLIFRNAPLLRKEV